MLIQINDGRKTYDIQNQDGEIVASVTFNPSNTNILKRADSVADRLDEILKDIKNMESSSKALEEKEEEVKRALNDLFCADVSTPFFNIMGVFSRVGKGQYFVSQVLEELMNIVKDAQKADEEASNKRMEEYLADYAEGEPK